MIKKSGATINVTSGDNGDTEVRLKLLDAFLDPQIKQLLMTSNVGRGECFKMATSLTLGRLRDESRYKYDEDGNLIYHESLDSILIQNLLLLKMSIGGKKGEQLTYLAEGEVYSEDDDLSSKPFKRA